MNIYLTIILSFILVVSGYNQSCKKKYNEKLEKSSKLIDCGANYTIEKLESGKCIVKRYFPENKQITHLATYISNESKVLHGLYEEKWDDGTTVTSGYFENNLKVGLWRENVNQTGFYNQGVKHGAWKTYKNDTLLIEVSNYVNGELHGEQIKLDSVGNVKIKEEFNNGKLISTTIDTTKIFIDLMPKFPGCENMNLTVDDFDICSKNKLLEYIYGNLKYPKKSRELEVQGKALAQFVISKDGSVINIKVLNGVDSDIKMLVTSILEKMPKWTPGKKDGKPVNVLYTIPIIFKLTD